MPQYGPRILGQEAYDKALKAEAENQAVHGTEALKYGPRIIGQEAYDQLVAGKGQPEGPAPASGSAEVATAEPLTIAELRSALKADPASLASHAAAELASESPRKGALQALQDAAIEAEDEGLLGAIEAALAALNE